MGLDISGKKFNKLEEHSEDTMEVFTLDGFERSLLDEEAILMDFEHENWEYVGDGPSMGYGRYNSFRNELSIACIGLTAEEVWNYAADLEDDQPYPNAIYHIVNFADNEGFIGPAAVKLLDTYFTENKDRVRKNLIAKDQYYADKFDQLAECIKDTAKANGYLEFS